MPRCFTLTKKGENEPMKFAAIDAELVAVIDYLAERYVSDCWRE